MKKRKHFLAKEIEKLYLALRTRSSNVLVFAWTLTGDWIAVGAQRAKLVAIAS
jgi:hypothetical protein